jgi:hypothetical protein
MLGGEILVLAALAYVIAAEAPESVKALFELTLVTIPIVAPFLAVVPATVAWSLRSDPDVPRWFVVVSAVAAVAIAVPTVGYAYSGPLSPARRGPAGVGSEAPPASDQARATALLAEHAIELPEDEHLQEPIAFEPAH